MGKFITALYVKNDITVGDKELKAGETYYYHFDDEVEAQKFADSIGYILVKNELELPTPYDFKPGYSYSAHHIPTGEDWYIIGIDVTGNRVCAAGWPPTIAKLSDCKDMSLMKPLTEKEIEYRTKEFGTNWL